MSDADRTQKLDKRLQFSRIKSAFTKYMKEALVQTNIIDNLIFIRSFGAKDFMKENHLDSPERLTNDSILRQ